MTWPDCVFLMKNRRPVPNGRSMLCTIKEQVAGVDVGMRDTIACVRVFDLAPVALEVEGLVGPAGGTEPGRFLAGFRTHGP